MKKQIFILIIPILLSNLLFSQTTENLKNTFKISTGFGYYLKDNFTTTNLNAGYSRLLCTNLRIGTVINFSNSLLDINQFINKSVDLSFYYDIIENKKISISFVAGCKGSRISYGLNFPYYYYKLDDAFLIEEYYFALGYTTEIEFCINLSENFSILFNPKFSNDFYRDFHNFTRETLDYKLQFDIGLKIKI